MKYNKLEKFEKKILKKLPKIYLTLFCIYMYIQKRSKKIKQTSKIFDKKAIIENLIIWDKAFTKKYIVKFMKGLYCKKKEVKK